MKALPQFRQIIIISPARLSLRNDSIVIKIVDHNQEQALKQLSTLVVGFLQTKSRPSPVDFFDLSFNIRY